MYATSHTRVAFALAPVLVAVIVWSCGSFSGSDVASNDFDSGVKGDSSGSESRSADGGAASSDAGADAEWAFPLDGGPAVACRRPIDPGNVKFTAPAESPKSKTTFTVSVIAPSPMFLSSTLLALCTPNGPINMTVGSEVTMGSALEFDFVVEGGVPAGVTELYFQLDPDASATGSKLITVVP